ncbi:P-type conjugative transfer protein TrbL [Ancylobacter lacus]|uniref:P-type conjugative transfer protein TrbL n=1 Tax=Ancylobacter lacus TaxID=2579970 RepID=UPI001BCFD21A|nr:P-type conjugative transfer protein TrbL [Ancylobacter lacus]MBS7538441.1 P-type conjugative transfer protein TrbL [Ancylobacter lacus]
MGDTGVIDHFLEVFTRYIDSGFGLLSGEVAFIATTLIVIDVTLAALFWSWGADDDIIARLVKKTLFVGVFAYIIGNWNTLARIVFESFAGLGLKASGTGFTTTDLLRPGKVAQTGFDAARPLIESISDLMGFVAFFENFIQIACLLFAWALVMLAFFILAIQLFVTLIEFKLTTLAGFVLIPFGLFGKSAFMAERVLGNIISSGIKVLVLAVIIGIGSTLFSEFTAGFGGETPTIDQAMAIVLAALSLLGLGIFGPGIASGLVSGGPQLGAGAAIGTGLAAGGMVAAGGAAIGAVASGGAALAGGVAAAARGGATLAGGATAAYRAGGASGIASTGASKVGAAIASPFKRAAASMKDGFQAGERAVTGEAAPDNAADASSASASSADSSGPPAWAKRMKRGQQASHGIQAAAHAVKSGDSHGGGSSVNLSESDR